jgi:hypothetical protein
MCAWLAAKRAGAMGSKFTHGRDTDRERRHGDRWRHALPPGGIRRLKAQFEGALPPVICLASEGEQIACSIPSNVPAAARAAYGTSLKCLRPDSPRYSTNSSGMQNFFLSLYR